MGKKPVLGIVSAFCVGLALTGCQTCSSCHNDGAKLAKNSQAPSKPTTTAVTGAPSTTGAAAASATAGWNNSGTIPKPAVAAPADLPTALGTDKTASKPTEPVATSKNPSPSVQPAGFTPPPPDAAAPMETNTSHFPPPAAGRILPSPPALATGSSLPPLADEHPLPTKLDESMALPPPPPPPPSASHSVSNDAPSAPPGTLPPPPPPGPNG